MRAAVLLAVVAFIAGCGGGADRASGPAGVADMVVRVDRDGPQGPRPAQELRVRCADPAASEACGAAAGVSAADLRPVPKDTACTQNYGGPQTAQIVGILRGQHVDARFSRNNGCQIARWNRVADLLGEVR